MKFLIRWILYSTIPIFIILTLVNNLSAQKKQPNNLVIMADDIGLSNLGCFSGDIMGAPTPNIDKLASQGLKLTTFYGHPSCTAGRAAFITGQLPIRTGLTTVGVPGSEVGLQPEDPTLADILKSKAYSTAQFGKNHLGILKNFYRTGMASMFFSATSII
jgi:arylsulfatase A-like enzyme